MRLNFGDYLKPDDSLNVDVELATNRLMAPGVNNYLDSPEDTITMYTQLSVLQDSTIYTKRTTLDASSKQLGVTVENSDYKRIAP